MPGWLDRLPRDQRRSCLSRLASSHRCGRSAARWCRRAAAHCGPLRIHGPTRLPFTCLPQPPYQLAYPGTPLAGGAGGNGRDTAVDVASVVFQQLTLTRIAGRPCQVVGPHQHVPSFWTAAMIDSVLAPKSTSTWLSTTSFSTPYPADRMPSANRRARQHRHHGITSQYRSGSPLCWGLVRSTPDQSPALCGVGAGHAGVDPGPALPGRRGAGDEVALLGDAERPARGELVLHPRCLVVAGHVQ